MAIYIRNEEACRLIRELAALLGVSLERAVYVAVTEQLDRLNAEKVSKISPKTPAPKGKRV